jgi:acetolactate decarboxylase
MRQDNSRFFIIILALIIIICCTVFYIVYQFQLSNSASADRETLFQVAAFNTFSLGDYDGIMAYSEIAEHGDFGIGTFDGLDGEMVALKGIFYQIPVDGKPKQVDPSIKAPYITVTFFDSDQIINVAVPLNYSELQTYIDGLLPTDDAIYAIKIHGSYDYALTRSVPKQTIPYPPLSEAIKNQSIFTLNNISGTAIGFWFPSSMDGVDFVGYNLHFITDDVTAGGHLLDCIARNITIEIDQTNKYNLVLP